MRQEMKRLNWTPAIAGGTYVQNNTHNAALPSFNTSEPYHETHSGAVNPYTYTGTTTGFPNFLYFPPC